MFCATRTTTALSWPCQCLIWPNHGVARVTPNQKTLHQFLERQLLNTRVCQSFHQKCKSHSSRVRCKFALRVLAEAWMSTPWTIGAFLVAEGDSLVRRLESWALRQHHAHGKCTNFGQAQGFCESLTQRPTADVGMGGSSWFFRAFWAAVCFCLLRCILTVAVSSNLAIRAASLGCIERS